MTVKYDEKDFYCCKHFERYVNYCSQCKLNICESCNSEYKSHSIIKLTPYNNSQLIKEKDELKNNIEDLTKSIN